MEAYLLSDREEVDLLANPPTQGTAVRTEAATKHLKRLTGKPKMISSERNQAMRAKLKVRASLGTQASLARSRGMQNRK